MLEVAGALGALYLLAKYVVIPGMRGDVGAAAASPPGAL